MSGTVGQREVGEHRAVGPEPTVGGDLHEVGVLHGRQRRGHRGVVTGEGDGVGRTGRPAGAPRRRRRAGPGRRRTACGATWWWATAAARDHIAALGATVRSRPARRGQRRPRHLVQRAGRDDHDRAVGQVERAEQQRVELVGTPGAASHGGGGPVALADGQAAQGEQDEVVGGDRRPHRTDLVQPARRRPSPRRRAGRRRSGPARRARCRRGGGAARPTTSGGSRSSSCRARSDCSRTARSVVGRRRGRRGARPVAGDGVTVAGAGTAENPRALARWRSAHRSTSRPRPAATARSTPSWVSSPVKRALAVRTSTAPAETLPRRCSSARPWRSDPPGPRHVALGDAGRRRTPPSSWPDGRRRRGRGSAWASPQLVAGPGQVAAARSPAAPPTPGGRAPRRASRCGASSPAIRRAAVEQPRPAPARRRSRASSSACTPTYSARPGPLRPLRGPQPPGGGGGVALGLGGVAGGEAGPRQEQAGLVEVGDVVRRPQAVDRRLRLDAGVVAQPGEQHHLGPVGVEHRELAGRRRRAGGSGPRPGRGRAGRRPGDPGVLR